MSHPRRSSTYDDDLEPEEAFDDEDEELDEEQNVSSSRKRRRSNFIDDAAEEVDEDEEEEYDDEDDDYGGGRKAHKQKKRLGSQFIDMEAEVDSDDDLEEDEEGEDDFINDTGADLNEDHDAGRLHRRPLISREDDQEDVEALERRIQARYARSSHSEYEEEETTEVEQQALLPSIRDPKLWMVKCAIGREREVAVCLMQKCLDRGPELQIRSVIALDHLKNYIYVEAEKEAHVKEACKGLRNVFSFKVMLVPIREMTDVLSVGRKIVDVARDSWVRMKIGTYKGDLAQVVDVDNVRQRVTVKLIPRIDLQAQVSKMEGREVVKKKAFVPQARLMNIDEVREMNIRVERRRDPLSGDYFENIFGMSFRDGFLYKTVSMRSIHAQNIQPSFDELEKFRPGDAEEGGDTLSSMFANRKKGHFMKGDRVIVVKGDLKNLKGWVEKVEEDDVQIRPKMDDLPTVLSVNAKELCKYFDPGNHVKVVSGTQKGATGMVITVEGHLVIILSDTTKEHVQVFSDHVVESSEVTTGLTHIGDYELHDLVLLDNMTFGIITRIESDAFQILKGVPDRPEVSLVKLREIKLKIQKRNVAPDQFRNIISIKDIVKVLDGPCKGKQGPVEHIYRGVLFIYDRHHLEHSGFICAKSQSCLVVGGARGGDKDSSAPRFASLTNLPPRSTLPPRGRGTFPGGGRGWHDPVIGKTVKIRFGHHKGYRGRIVDVKGQSLRVELESQMKVVTVDRSQITDNVFAPAPHHDSQRYGSGSETPMHPSRTPLHNSGATPVHDGMRTPRRDRAWNPTMTPSRDSWEEANPSSWGGSSTPQYHPNSPGRGAATPTSAWSNNTASEATSSSSGYSNAASPYVPTTPTSASYLPGTPGGQPMTPGGGLDAMSPAVDGEGPWILSDTLVSVSMAEEGPLYGVVREVSPDGMCRVAMGKSGNSGRSVTVHTSKVEAVTPRKNDRVKILGGTYRGLTGKLIGVDGTDGIVKVDDNLDVKILDMAVLAKIVHPRT